VKKGITNDQGVTVTCCIQYSIFPMKTAPCRAHNILFTPVLLVGFPNKRPHENWTYDWRSNSASIARTLCKIAELSRKWSESSHSLDESKNGH